MLTTIYRGSVKNLLGPTQIQDSRSQESFQSVVFQYSDAFSVFDWGRMPDDIPDKGKALAVMTAAIFEKLQDPKTWLEFSRSKTAFEIRKGITDLDLSDKEAKFNTLMDPPRSLGATFNDLGEKLQNHGMQTHYLGLLSQQELNDLDRNQVGVAHPTSEIKEPVSNLAVKQVSVVEPKMERVLGQTIMDYEPTRSSRKPRLIPLEVIFRFSCPKGSSLIKRVERQPGYLQTLPLPRKLDAIEPGASWALPIVELFTKLESHDRPISTSEALAISGISAAQFEEMILKTVWLGGWLRDLFLKKGIDLADGKFEWALSEDGEVFLVDAIGPDELRLLINGAQLSKEFLREFYRNSDWHEQVARAQYHAERARSQDWKRMVSETPPRLPEDLKILASQVYLSLANEISEKKWFEQAWSISKVIDAIRAVKEKSL